MNQEIKILVINGPNLNMLGKREPEVYGSRTLDEINDGLNKFSKDINVNLEFYQSNHELEIAEGKVTLINRANYANVTYVHMMNPDAGYVPR